MAASTGRDACRWGEAWSTTVPGVAPQVGTHRIGMPLSKRNSKVIHKSLQDMWIAHVDYCLQTLEVAGCIELVRRNELLKTNVDSCAPKTVFFHESRASSIGFYVEKTAICTSRVNNVWIASELLFYKESEPTRRSNRWSNTDFNRALTRCV